MITERDAIQCLVKMAQKAKRNLDNVKSTATEDERKSLLLKYETLSWAVGCCIDDMKFNSDYHNTAEAFTRQIDPIKTETDYVKGFETG